MVRTRWWRSRFFWKLYAGFVVVIAMVSTAMAVVLSRMICADTTEEIRHELRHKAALLREIATPALSAWDGAGLQPAVLRLGQETATRLTVIRADGVVVADSNEQPARMENHLNRPEVQQAIREGWGQAQRYSETLQVKMMYVALLVREDSRTLGYIRTALPLSTIDEHLNYLRNFTIMWSVVAALAALIVGIVIAQHIGQPVAAITAAVRSLTAGDYTAELRPSSSDEVGELARAFNTLRSELRQRIETITTERNQLSEILAGMVEGVIAVDRDERIMHLNAVAAAAFSTQPEACLGKRVWEVIRIPAVVNTISGAMQSSMTTQMEISVAHQDKDSLLELHASPLRDSHGELAGAVLVLHDVTELRRLETVRREFVANVSHELKTPLTAIHGFVETLLDDEQMPLPTQRRFLGKMRDQSARLAALVSDLLTLSRIESEHSVLELQPLDIREPVQDSANSLSALAEEQGLALALALPAEPVTVLGDHEALRQMVGNLLDNAIKYTPAGGRITLSVESDGSQAVVAVSDSGIGIEPQEQQRIFERFYRVDKARSRALGGTGLGLSIVKHLTLALGGQVAVESTPGQGSTFRVTLPLATGSGGGAK